MKSEKQMQEQNSILVTKKISFTIIYKSKCPVIIKIKYSEKFNEFHEE